MQQRRFELVRRAVRRIDLGADGDGAHTLNEYILVSTLEQRLKFWELLLKELA